MILRPELASRVFNTPLLMHPGKLDAVLAGIGGFGALFEVPKRYQEPVLVSGTDGVGVGLDVAQDDHRISGGQHCDGAGGINPPGPRGGPAGRHRAE